MTIEKIGVPIREIVLQRTSFPIVTFPAFDQEVMQDIDNLVYCDLAEIDLTTNSVIKGN